MTTASSAPTLEREADRLDALFTPKFDVKIAGTALATETLRDISSVTYEDSVSGMDGFELVVANADLALGPDGKYAGPETDSDLQGSGAESDRYRLFEPSDDEVELSMGYEAETQVMLTGTIVTMEPAFPARGPMVLRVRALNALHQLRTKPYSYVWKDKKDSEIARALGGLTDPDTGQSRFPLPVRVSSDAQSAEASLPFVIQENQHDIEFLMQRAKLRGYVISVGRDSGGPYLYFGPSDGDTRRGVTYQLEYGRSLLSFHASMGSVRQVRSVTVHGWNRDTDSLIEKTVDYTDSRIETNRDLDRILERCAARDDIIVDKPIFTDAAAEALALDVLRERRHEFVRANGVAIGLANLRAGTRVQIHGVGSRFGGVYYVTSSSHTIDGDGYRTSFRAHREAEQ